MCNSLTYLKKAPSSLEIREVVRKLQNGQAAGAAGLQAKHIKMWLWDVVQEETEAINVGHGSFKWRIFVKLMQSIWEHGCLPEQMMWKIITLLPKGGGDYHGIGLLEPCWKVLEKIMVK
jgi:hypothetical protein